MAYSKTRELSSQNFGCKTCCQMELISGIIFQSHLKQEKLTQKMDYNNNINKNNKISYCSEKCIQNDMNK